MTKFKEIQDMYKQYEPLDQQDDKYLDTIEENLKALEKRGDGDIQPTDSEWQ
jgi:hypothetical protein